MAESKKVRIEIVRGTVVDQKRIIPDGKKPAIVETDEKTARRLIATHHARVPEEKPVKGAAKPGAGGRGDKGADGSGGDE